MRESRVRTGALLQTRRSLLYPLLIYPLHYSLGIGMRGRGAEVSPESADDDAKRLLAILEAREDRIRELEDALRTENQARAGPSGSERSTEVAQSSRDEFQTLGLR